MNWPERIGIWTSLVIAVTSLVIAVTSLAIAVLTFFQLRDVRHNFETDQRAWLKVDYGFQEHFSVSNLVVQVQIKNIGKSVALHGIAYTKVEIADSEKGPTFKLPFSYQATLPAIFPTDIQAFPVTRTSNNPTAEFQDLLNGKSYVAIFGQVVYSDQFGQHWTRYCT